MSGDTNDNGGEPGSIEVYSWPTPNGHPVHIMLEQCGLPYRVHAVDIGAGAQFEPGDIAGDADLVADMAIFPWLRSWQSQGIDWADHPKPKQRFDEIAERPAVQRGVAVLAAARRPLIDDRARDALFGATQYRPR